MADEFVPLQSILQGYDEVDQFIDEANVDFDYHDQRAHERVDDMVLKESLRLKLDSYDDTAEPHNPCMCHNILRGSCPEFKQYHVDRIARGLLQTGLTPNMDGLKEPLRYLSFPVAAWEKALHGYFVPYIDQELKFGALMGPFDENELPFYTYCSPLNMVPKKNSETRRTVVDCSQIGTGINSFIDAHMHRGKYWKLSLPTSQSIIARIQRAHARYPGQRILIFKLDFQRWYRWFILDPVSSIFFAIRWRGKIFLDTALSFGNWGAALAALRVIWAIVHFLRTRLPPFPGSYNLGATCRCPDHCDCGENDAEGYIDDFLAFAPKSLAHMQFDAAIQLARSLGLRLSQTPGHVSPPNAVCECLGILYDTDHNTMK